MKRFLSKTIAAFSSGLVVLMAPIALSQTVQTPLRSTVQVTGNSGGTQTNDACRGFMFSATPAQVIQVTEPSASLSFRAEGSGQLALLVTGAGSPICVPSTGAGEGVTIPGVWQRGTYSVFVGNRATTGSPFTLSIVQEN
ncbi:MAG: hypothetical protein HC881_10480 [Leptolyngbyaceae cyanobacterium SL_7_1]|nr:hypothetical protein [Leptolyngbyaceae cyanobacterium SL_7_1]